MRLYGRVLGVRGGCLEFADDLAQQPGPGRRRRREHQDHHRQVHRAQQLEAPKEARYVPVWEPREEPRRSAGRERHPPRRLVHRLSRRLRVDRGPIFDGRGYPVHRRGVTTAEGLYFLGLPWLYTWGSGRLSGVAADATHLADQIASRAGKAARPPATAALNELALGS